MTGEQGELFDPGPGRPSVPPQRSDVDGCVIRVVPDVRGVRSEFDYVVPEALGVPEVGTVVDVDLGGRRLRAWVVAVGVTPEPGVQPKFIRGIRSAGPTPDVVDLTSWGAWRFVGARSALLATASPTVRVPVVPAADAMTQPLSDERIAAVGDALRDRLQLGGGSPLRRGPSVVRIPPSRDPADLVVGLVDLGPLLVVVPTQRGVVRVAERLRQTGHAVATTPDDWAHARRGAASVVGTRVAAWWPCSPLGAVVVLDEHDEGHAQQHSPTWHARAVALQRAADAGVPCVLVSPVPTLEALAVVESLGGPAHPGRDVERAGWPIVELVDTRVTDPLRGGLITERLADVVRDGARVLCVLNRKGRARLVACGGCRALARCAQCGSSVSDPGSGDLVCASCGDRRPMVCLECGRTSMRVVRRGVGRLREDLELLAGEPVAEVTASGAGPEAATLRSTRLVVGTSAALLRAGRRDVVAFVDLDGDLLAPRYRAAEEVMALLAGAGRLVAPRGRGSDAGRIIVQTSVPDDPALVAAVLGDPASLSTHEAARRAELGWPPATAAALLSHAGAASFAAALAADGSVEVLGPLDGRYVARAPDHQVLCDALAAAPRPAERLRIEVDPLRF